MADKIIDLGCKVTAFCDTPFLLFAFLWMISWNSCLYLRIETCRRDYGQTSPADNQWIHEPLLLTSRLVQMWVSSSFRAVCSKAIIGKRKQIILNRKVNYSASESTNADIMITVIQTTVKIFRSTLAKTVMRHFVVHVDYLRWPWRRTAHMTHLMTPSLLRSSLSKASIISSPCKLWALMTCMFSINSSTVRCPSPGDVTHDCVMSFWLQGTYGMESKLC